MKDSKTNIKVDPEMVLQEFREVQKELSKNNYQDRFKKVCNETESSEYSDRRYKQKETKRVIEEFHKKYGK